MASTQNVFYILT